MTTAVPRSPRPLLGLLSAALLGVAAAAQDDEPAEVPRVLLETLGGEVSVCPAGDLPLESLADAGVAFVRFAGLPRTPGPGRIEGASLASLELAGGDRLKGVVRGGEGDVLQLELRPGVRLDLGIDGIRSIVHPDRIPDSVTESPTAGPPEEGDRLYLVAANSLDRAQGFVEAFSAEGVAFHDERLGQRTFPWSRVAALFIAPLDDEPGAGSEGPGEGEPGGGELAEGESAERVSVTLSGGGRISGALVRIGAPEQGIELRIGGGASVELPGAIVEEVSLDDGSFRFLSDVAPDDRGQSSPFGDELGFVWPMRVDRNCRGGLLSVGGVVHDRGIGVHAPSRLTWEVGRRWASLRLSCGVDDSGQSGTRAGAVRFRVLGDGAVLWESEVVRGGALAVRPDDISLEGISSLVLEVDPAGDFVLDRANWVRPMLLR